MKNKQSQEINRIVEIDNPYVGIRPFTISETNLFFGRDEHISRITDKLLIEQFVIVSGAGGIGKTSLINSGIIPNILNKGNWKLISARIGENFLDDLLQEVTRITENDAIEIDADIENESKKQRIITYLKRSYKKDRSNYLIHIEQFEQVFLNFGVYLNERREQMRKLFLSAIVDLIKQADFPVYVIMSLGSEYMNKALCFGEFADLLDKGNYELPSMSRSELRRVIEGPLEISGNNWDPVVVEKVLDTYEDHPDALFLVQHLMSRLFSNWKESDERKDILTAEHYDETMDPSEMISSHAESVFLRLSEGDQKTCEKIFRNLTEKTEDNLYIRQPVSVKDLAEIAQVRESVVLRILGKFHTPGFCFIQTDKEELSRKDQVVYLSHYLLIRYWERLQTWVDEEASSVKMYKKLAESAYLFQLGKSELWVNPDLDMAIKWKEANNPNLAWGRRHNPAFERTMVFLSLSENELYLEQEEKERILKLRKKLTWVGSGVIGIIAVLILVMSIASGKKKNPQADNLPVEPGQEQIAGVVSEDENPGAAESSVPVAIEDNNSQVGLASEEQAKGTGAETVQPETAGMPGSGVGGEQVEQGGEEIESPVDGEAILQQPETSDSDSEPGTTEEIKPEELPDNPSEEISTEIPEKKEALSAAEMKAVSTSLAEESVKNSTDPDLKALLAYQAFLFNREFNNGRFQTDIYNALLSNAKVRQGSSFNSYRGHTKGIRTLDFMPNTSTFFSAGSDGQILKWNLGSGRKSYSTILSGRGMIEKIEVSPNGNFMVIAESKKGLQLLNLSANSKNTVSLDGEEQNIRALAVSVDNNSVYTAGLNNFIERYSVKDKKAEKVINTDARINALAVSSDGSKLAGSTRSGKVLIWRANNGYSEEIIYNNSGNQVLSLKFSPNGKYLACGTKNGDVLLLNAVNFKTIRRLKAHTARVTEVDFSPDSRYLASSGYDSKVYYWNLSDSGMNPVQIADNGGFIFAVNISADGRFIVSGSAQDQFLIATPATLSQLAGDICTQVSRNFTQAEWSQYIGSNIPYRQTCTNK